jgi:hypothetical protein
MDVQLIEIINNTRGGIVGEIWEPGNGGKLKSRMNTTQFLGYTWNQKNLKQKSQNWVFYTFCMSLLQTFPKNFEFKRLIPLEKIKIANISIILERSQKCV